MKKYNFAIVGATGVVGRMFLKVLEERNLPIDNLYLFASSKSKGSILSFNGQDYIVEELTESSFDKNIDIALFSAGGAISEKFAPIASKKGIIVIDNSSFWRMHKDVPLIVPEVNASCVLENHGIIANPNCSTIQAVVALKPLHDKYKIKRIVYSTYQAVSGAGANGIRDFNEGIYGKEPIKFPYPIFNNVLPHIDSFLPDGYTKEELKMINETRKILGDDSIKITATTARVPVLNSHCESINVEFFNEFDLDQLKLLLKNSDGVVFKDDPENNIYPMPLKVTSHDEVFVGRVRRDFSVESGINLWVVADNIRKGAATNAVQIASLLIDLWERD